MTTSVLFFYKMYLAETNEKFEQDIELYRENLLVPAARKAMEIIEGLPLDD